MARQRREEARSRERKVPGEWSKAPQSCVQGACWGAVENKWLQEQVGVGLVGTKGTSVLR